jgi:hypothetical protein
MVQAFWLTHFLVKNTGWRSRVSWLAINKDIVLYTVYFLYEAALTKICAKLEPCKIHWGTFWECSPSLLHL